MRKHISFVLLALIALLSPLYSQQAIPWRDPSAHKIRFVTIDKEVRLEVLDWGGHGRPLILLAGGGNTAHVFDDFAPKLTANYRVYGITRRGFGASGFSPTGNDIDRLGEDVVTVIAALRLKRPVLVGHSFAGAELSWIANSRPDLVAGLVYLEAGYPYAFDNGKGPSMNDFQDLRGPKNAARPADLSSFSALQKWYAQEHGFTWPESEFRQTWDSTPDGRPMKEHNFPGLKAVITVVKDPKKFASIKVPALVIFASPHAHETWMDRGSDPATQKTVEVYYTKLDALKEKQAQAFEEGVGTAHVVRLRGAHFIFASNEREVLREIRSFVLELK